jgi:hypothetical protein
LTGLAEDIGSVVDVPTVRLIGMVCADLGIVSTAIYHLVRVRELAVLRNIRDRMGKHSADT